MEGGFGGSGYGLGYGPGAAQRGRSACFFEGQHDSDSGSSLAGEGACGSDGVSGGGQSSISGSCSRSSLGPGSASSPGEHCRGQRRCRGGEHGGEESSGKGDLSRLKEDRGP